MSVVITGNIRRVAFHEAGHAVADLLLGLSFNAVSIMPECTMIKTSQNGREIPIEKICPVGVSLPQERKDKNTRELGAGILDLREAISTMAGPQAEAISVGEIDKETNEGAKIDMAYIMMCCRAAIFPGIPWEQRPPCAMELDIIRILSEQAQILLRENWAAVEAVAGALLKRQCLSYSEVEALIKASASPKKRN
jgi:hypothetical protein